MGYCSPKPVPAIDFSKRATPAMTPASCLTTDQPQPSIAATNDATANQNETSQTPSKCEPSPAM